MACHWTSIYTQAPRLIDRIQPSLHAIEAILKARFGPKALISQLGAIWMVHVDQPTEAEIQERLAEVQQELLEPEDCAGCDSDPMRPQAGNTLIYDEVMCLIEPAPWRKLYPDLDAEGELGWMVSSP